MSSRPAVQLWLPLEVQGELFSGMAGAEHPVAACEQLMERVLERDNLLRALRQVERNGGSPGIDGMTVEELRPWLREHWPAVRAALLVGSYVPQAVRRVWIPKPNGGRRGLGVPIVLDRFLQQALLQVLQADWDPTFSEHSFGFRPELSAHDALLSAQTYLRTGYRWVVDMDLEKFFDRVNHDKLMGEVCKRVSDRRVLRLIHAYLRAGAVDAGAFQPTPEGTPQGGPLSPLLANLLLDGLDRELTRRGLRFVRYADDCNIYVRSRRAGQRVLASISRFLARRLKLTVNAAKSAVGRPWERKFLGFSFNRWNRRFVHPAALRAFRAHVRLLTQRTRGRSVQQIAHELALYLRGWHAYFGFADSQSIFKELDSWVRRRLRCYLLKQWGRRRYRALVARGVSRDLAWNTTKSAHGPWRLSRSPALAFALPQSYFDSLGLPRLYVRST